MIENVFILRIIFELRDMFSIYLISLEILDPIFKIGRFLEAIFNLLNFYWFITLSWIIALIYYQSVCL